jgi:hypothetical protein
MFKIVWSSTSQCFLVRLAPNCPVPFSLDVALRFFFFFFFFFYKKNFSGVFFYRIVVFNNKFFTKTTMKAISLLCQHKDIAYHRFRGPTLPVLHKIVLTKVSQHSSCYNIIKMKMKNKAITVFNQE